MAPGYKTGGRKKGVPNKVTSDVRKSFQLVFEARIEDLDRWLQETGEGYEVERINDDGKPIKLKVDKNPGKAADIITRMAEHFVPKLQRIEKTIVDSTDEELLAEVVRRKAAADSGGLQ